MPQTRARRGPAHPACIESTTKKSNSQVAFTRLEHIPIEDAFREKELFEKGDFERKLNPSHTLGPVVVSERMIEERIIEVYKRCLDQAGEGAENSVVRDFVSHFPHLVFEADWLRTLMRSSLDSDRERRRSHLLATLASGFRSAARQRRPSATQVSYRHAGARITLRAIQDGISRWCDELDKENSTAAWLAAAVATKAQELAETYRQSLRQADKRRLSTLLKRGHSYEAALLITARIFRMRERDLQSRAAE